MGISQGDRVKNNELNERRLQATPRGIGVMCNFFAERAENATLWDVEGNEVIDFAAGIAVLNTGHRHPKVVAAVEKQLHAFTHTAYQVVPYESYVTLAEKINARVPVEGPAKPPSSLPVRKRLRTRSKSPAPIANALA